MLRATMIALSAILVSGPAPAQVKPFDQAFIAKGKLTMPILAVGGQKSFSPMMATVMQAAATDVTEAAFPASGHWVMEENPAATIKLATDFLK